MVNLKHGFVIKEVHNKVMLCDILSRLISRAVANGLLKGVKGGSKLLSHVQFADNTILFLDEDAKSSCNALSLINLFECAFRMKINMYKSKGLYYD